MELNYFEISEFDSPDVEGSGSLMDIDFLLRLDAVRETCGIPFKINSGYRTSEWNLKVGGRIGSSHLKGVAVDIHITNTATRTIILTALIKAGFTRIGIGHTFIHVDADTDKPNAIWLY